MTQITQVRLKELFDYSVVTGQLFTKQPRGRYGRTPVGAEQVCARFYHKNGRPKYAQLEIDGEKWYYHRLIWLWVTGELPPENVDHRNQDICCNAWHNLRDATVSENACNRGMQSNNTSGHKGVFWNANKKCWVARIGHKKVYYNLGRFDTPEQASAVYNKKCAELHAEFACHD